MIDQHSQANASIIRVADDDTWVMAKGQIRTRIQAYYGKHAIIFLIIYGLITLIATVALELPQPDALKDVVGNTGRIIGKSAITAVLALLNVFAAALSLNYFRFTSKVLRAFDAVPDQIADGQHFKSVNYLLEEAQREEPQSRGVYKILEGWIQMCHPNLQQGKSAHGSSWTRLKREVVDVLFE